MYAEAIGCDKAVLNLHKDGVDEWRQSVVAVEHGAFDVPSTSRQVGQYALN